MCVLVRWQVMRSVMLWWRMYLLVAWSLCVIMFFYLMIRRPPRSTLTEHSFPTRRSSDLRDRFPNRTLANRHRYQRIAPIRTDRRPVGLREVVCGAGDTPQPTAGLDVPEIGNRPTLRRTLLTFRRSEEHTSELQSLMRSSYAVFCLKTKKTNQKNTTTTIAH